MGRRNSKYVYRAESATPPPAKVQRKQSNRKQRTQSLKKRIDLCQAEIQRVNMQWARDTERLINNYTRKKKKKRNDRRKGPHHKMAFKKLSRRVVRETRRRKQLNRAVRSKHSNQSNGKSKQKRGKPLSGSGMHTMRNTGTKRRPSWNRHYDNW